jgi:hypothetical protein
MGTILAEKWRSVKNKKEYVAREEGEVEKE